MPNQVGGDLLHTMDVYRLSRVRTELQSLWVIESLTPRGKAQHCLFSLVTLLVAIHQTPF